MPGEVRDRRFAADLVAATLVALLAAAAYAMLPDGNVVRLALAAAVLFFVPGYLLIEAAAGPPAARGARYIRAGLAFGVSPGIIGLLALATAPLPGGFRPEAIVGIVTLACPVLAGAALLRRRRSPQPVVRPAMSPA